MQYEKSDYGIGIVGPVFKNGVEKVMPQTHYRCDNCDYEFVRTGRSRLRMLDGATL